MRKFLSLAFLLFVGFGSHSRGNPGKSGWTFASFQNAITALRFNVGRDSPDDQELAAMSSDLKTIHDAYLQKYGGDADTEAQIPKNLGSDYSRSMQDNLDVIKDPPPTPNRLATLRDIRADLDVKATAVTRTMQLVSGSFPSIVDVDVRVQMGQVQGTSVANLSVRANAHIHGTDPPATYIFSPAGPSNFRTRMPPGRFWIWVESGAGVIQKQEYDIGRVGNSENISFNL
jgi:hypothetical protein